MLSLILLLFVSKLCFPEFCIETTKNSSISESVPNLSFDDYAKVKCNQFICILYFQHIIIFNVSLIFYQIFVKVLLFLFRDRISGFYSRE
jgi:hypothetical protein